ncbi:MAG: hypothetical protein ACFFFH_20410 [Candidatus Thorarchaeota archaeon]
MTAQGLDFPRNQTLLHQKLKLRYMKQVGGAEEVLLKINGRKYRIDVLDRERNTMYEIHLSNFGGKFSQKIRGILKEPGLKIVIVHPIVIKQKITRMKKGKILGVTNYNKDNNIYPLFEKLVYFNVEFIPERMELDAVFIKEHVLKEFIGYYGRSMRRKYMVTQRDLISIEEIMKFKTKSDFTRILPLGLPDVFTNRDLAERLETKGNKRRIQRISGLITYTLCRLGILNRVGFRGRAHEFTI